MKKIKIKDKYFYNNKKIKENLNNKLKDIQFIEYLNL